MSLTIQQRDYLCTEAINEYLFANIWNEPQGESRSNVKPIPLTDHSCIGSFSLIDANVKLPTLNELYYVWYIPSNDFLLNLQLPTGEWISSDVICNQYTTQINMYHTKGYVYHKESVFFRFNQSRSTLFIAVKKSMVSKVGSTYNDSYFTIYHDSDLVKDIKVLSVYAADSRMMHIYRTDINEFLKQLKDPKHLTVYKNGLMVPGEGVSFTEGDYIDYVIDENIQFVFDVELVTTNENPVYLSTEDKTWKQLIHIPKHLNPDNKVITHNTCEFFICDNSGATNTGTYLHRAFDYRSVSQVTHNDMSIPLFVIDAYRDVLGTQEVYIKCVVRDHNKGNVLIVDASYINLLYSEYHTDQDIIDILVGNGPPEIPWWYASNLEQSAYVKMLFDTPNMASVDKMKEYVDAIGFYQTVDILCKRIIDTIITDAYSGTLTYQLPVLYAGLEVIPLVYLNGKYLSRTVVNYSVDTSSNNVEIKIDESIVTKPGDQLTVIMFIDGEKDIYSFTPSGEGYSLTLPTTEVDVYWKTVSADVHDIQGVHDSTNIVYAKQKLGDNVYAIRELPDGSCEMTFSSEQTGRTFVIQVSNCSYYQTHDLSQFTASGKSISIPLVSTIRGTDDVEPILNFKNTSVFMNGKYLVKNIDYTVVTHTDKDDYIYFSELIIQTMDHFQIENSVDILINVAEMEELNTGFVLENQLRDAEPVNMYFPNITAVHVAGYLERDVDNKGVSIQIPEGKYTNGNVFEVQTSVPQVVKDFILEYASNDDLARIEVLNDYFYGMPYPKPDVIVLETKNRIYSIMMNNFIWDYVNGVITLVDDPDINRMNDQIKPYFYLRDIDLCFKGLDQTFIDYYPQYVNYAIDPSMKKIIDRFIAEYMPPNSNPTFETVYP